MQSVTSNAVNNSIETLYNSLGRNNILSNFSYFTALNIDITVELTEDIQDETVLHIILGTMINQSSTDIRLCDCPVIISKRLNCYIYNFFESRNNTQVMGLVKNYITGSKQLILNFFTGSLFPNDRYCVFLVIKG